MQKVIGSGGGWPDAQAARHLTRGEIIPLAVPVARRERFAH